MSIVFLKRKGTILTQAAYYYILYGEITLLWSVFECRHSRNAFKTGYLEQLTFQILKPCSYLC